jgi:hypothetical protein
LNEKHDSKAWIRLGNPYSTHDRGLFATATVVTMGNCEQTKNLVPLGLRSKADGHCDLNFWHLLEEKQHCLEKLWIYWINIDPGISLQHIQEFVAF